MTQIFKENIPLLTKTATTVLLASTFEGKGGRVTVGGRQYSVPTAGITLNAAVNNTVINCLDTGTLAANSLYYVYAVRSASAGFGLVASLAAPAVGPTGFTGWKEIGRFRTLFGAATIAIVINRLKGNNLQPESTTEWVSFVTTISASTPPTKGTVVVDAGTWRYTLDSMEIHYEYQQSAGGTAGSGGYTLSLPTAGLTADSSKIRVLGINPEISLIGTGVIQTTSLTQRAINLTMNNSSVFNMVDAITFNTISNTTGPLSDVSYRFSFNIRVPITELAGLWS